MPDAHHLRQLEKAETAAEHHCRVLVSSAFRQRNIEQAICDAQEILRAHLSERVNHYSALDWLFYLRSPSIRYLLAWLNDGLETAHHAEFFSSNSTKAFTDSERCGRGIRPLLNQQRFRRIAQFVGESFVWRQLHVFSSLLAMDIELVLTGNPPFPQKRTTPEQEKTLKLYNERVYTRPMILVSGGGIATTTGETDTEDTTFACVGTSGAQGFQVGPLGLAKFRDVFSLGILKPDFLQGLGDLLLALKVGYIAARNAGLRDQLDRYGMICIESKLVHSLIDQADPIARSISTLIPSWNYGSDGAVLARLSHVGRDVEFAPPLRTVGEWCAWDLFAASSLLDELLFRSMEKMSGERGPVFEDDAQALIDRTRWAPSSEMRSWKGRKLKVGERILTDIDAIGCHDGRLLLVECKSIYYGLAHGSAAKGEIRNAREKVEQAARRCSQPELVVATNLDLKGFAEIIRVVLTPAPVYVAAEYAETRTSGFPMSLSYWELYHLLYNSER
jgi:hypothetical protein